jgi:hypothetical protein
MRINVIDPERARLHHSERHPGRVNIRRALDLLFRSSIRASIGSESALAPAASGGKTLAFLALSTRFRNVPRESICSPQILCSYTCLIFCLSYHLADCLSQEAIESDSPGIAIQGVCGSLEFDAIKQALDVT